MISAMADKQVGLLLMLQNLPIICLEKLIEALRRAAAAVSDS
jgi:hypothetical protein